MIDRDDIVFKVAVFPTQANNLSYATPSTKEYSKQVKKTGIFRSTANEVNKELLLIFGQGMTLILSPPILLFQFSIYLISWICTDIAITYSYILSNLYPLALSVGLIHLTMLPSAS